MAALRKLGARSVPIVSRGDRFVFAQVIKGRRRLPRAAGRYRAGAVARAARGEARPDPPDRGPTHAPDADGRLEDLLPNRPRSWRVLMHHVYRIPAAFLDMEEQGRSLTYEALTEPPPAGMRTSAAIADHGEAGAGTLRRMVEPGGRRGLLRPGAYVLRRHHAARDAGTHGLALRPARPPGGVSARAGGGGSGPAADRGRSPGPAPDRQDLGRELTARACTVARKGWRLSPRKPIQPSSSSTSRTLAAIAPTGSSPWQSARTWPAGPMRCRHSGIHQRIQSIPYTTAGPRRRRLVIGAS